MKVQEWQDKFLSLIYDSGLNIFPPALIKMIKNASDEDAAEFQAFIKDSMRQYESLTISVSGTNSELRQLFLSLEDVEDVVVEDPPVVEEGL